MHVIGGDGKPPGVRLTQEHALARGVPEGSGNCHASHNTGRNTDGHVESRHWANLQKPPVREALHRAVFSPELQHVSDSASCSCGCALARDDLVSDLTWGIGGLGDFARTPWAHLEFLPEKKKNNVCAITPPTAQRGRTCPVWENTSL